MAKDQLISYLNVITRYVVLLFVLLFPLLFWNGTTEYFETPKFVLLLLATGLLLVLWILRCITEGKFTITRTPADLPLVLLMAIAAVSTFFSDSRYVSILGNGAQIHGGAASIIVYILFYFALVSNLIKANIIKQAVNLLILSVVILSILSLLSYFGIHLLSSTFGAVANFTLTGSSFATTALAALLLPFPLIAILKSSNQELNSLEKTNGVGQIASLIGIKLFLGIISAVMVAVIVLTGSTATFVAAALVLVLILISTPSNVLQKNSLFLAIPIATAVILALSSFGPSVMPQIKTPLYDLSQGFPRQIQLPFDISWKVSVSAFRDSPFWGSGPATYLFDFTQYKPIEFNDSKFWNLRFDTAFNEYLGLLATLGAPGLIALLLLTVIVLSLAFKALFSDQTVLGLSLASSVIVFFCLLLLHSSTMVVFIVGLTCIALFMAVHKPVTQIMHVGITAAKNIGDQLKLSFDALPEVLLVIIIIGLGALYYYSGRFLLADLHHRNALNYVTTNQGLMVYNELVAAEQLNPYNDLYRTDLAQTNFALANAIAASKGPTEASPGGSLTDADRQNIQTLLSQAISEARAAVALSPNNPTNWEVLGAIYRQISGVAENALAFSLDAYGRAIQTDPLNPNLRLTVGGTYYSIRNYDLAIRFFNDAINLKPDLANGYFNLSVVLKDKGDLKTAIAAAERTVALLEPTSPDYQTAANYLAELKKQDEQASQKSTTTPPAAQATSPLENKNLPKVLDLPKPDQIATPEAIKKPSVTPTPTPTN